MMFFTTLFQILPANSNFQYFFENIRPIIEILGINSEILKFPDIIFFLFIPFVISVYALNLFIKGLKIFRRTNIVNVVFAVIITLIFLRFIYPFVFIASLGYLIVVKKWPRRLIYRIGFIGFMIILYWQVLPYLLNLIESL